MKVVKIIIDDKEIKVLNVDEQNINLLMRIIELFGVKDIRDPQKCAKPVF